MHRCLLLLPLLMAADPCVSGPQVGQRPGPYSFLIASGDNRGQQTCMICETDAKPAAIVFARKTSPALAKLCGTFDSWAESRPKDSARTWLTVLGEKTISQDDLAKWAKEAGLKTMPAGVFDDPDGPPSYKLNKDAEVTVLLFVDRKVTVNKVFRPGELTDAEAAKLAKELEKLGKK